VSLPPATGYSYALPAGWLHLDLDPARRAVSVRRVVRERVRREPRLAAHLGALDRLIHHECAVAAARGAERVSLLAEPVGGAVVTASVTFVVASLPEASALDAQAAARWLSAEHAQAFETDPQARLDVIELVQQDVVRRRWTETTTTGAGVPLEHRVWQLVAPWPGRPRVGLLTMASPCQPLWGLLETVFDAAAQTLHWTWPGAAAY
jgi:hypothetical protein